MNKAHKSLLERLQAENVIAAGKLVEDDPVEWKVTPKRDPEQVKRIVKHHDEMMRDILERYPEN